MLINLMALLKKAMFESLWFKAFLLIMAITCNSCQKTDLSKKQAAHAYEPDNALATTAPNVVLILADDFGYEIPTVNGGESYNTPNIDQLARDGISFTQCYASSNCSPSRFMLLSGKYNFRNYTEWGVMNRNTRTLGNMFSNAGYTAVILLYGLLVLMITAYGSPTGLNPKKAVDPVTRMHLFTRRVSFCLLTAQTANIPLIYSLITRSNLYAIIRVRHFCYITPYHFRINLFRQHQMILNLPPGIL
jgi:Sulfatase